jgi:adenylate cyclase
MLAQLPGINARWQETVGQPLGLGIGVHTGPALVGNIGSARKLKYGAMGLTVNAASRVQDATKKAGVSLLISSAVSERLPDGYTTRRVGPFALAGVSEEVTLFELSGQASTRVS